MKLDGTYGKPGHRRQRYKCTPRRGKSHVFTELLPREESWHEACEQLRAPPRSPRGPEGATQLPLRRPWDRRGAPRGRRRRRLIMQAHPASPGTAPAASESIARRASCASQTTASSSPTGSSSSRRSSSSPTGLPSGRRRARCCSIICPFRVRALDAYGKRIPAGRVAFDVFCAVGYQAGKPRLWRAEAFTSAHPVNWSAFLGCAAGRAQADRLRRPRRDAAGDRGALARRRASSMRVASAACA